MDKIDSKKIKTLTGKVVSSTKNKTAVVEIERRLKHSLYGKTIKRSTRLKVHDEHGSLVNGQTIKIKSVKPLSKNKSWAVADSNVSGDAS